MYVPFSAISPTSRIWVFQADRKMSTSEVALISEQLRDFTEGWAAHGEPLKTSYSIEFDQFIILAADEDHHSPSGCSIDSSVRVLKGIEQSTGIKLFDRNLVAFKSGSEIILFPLGRLKEKFADGTLNRDTLTFNNLVTTKSDLEDHWLQPAVKSWLSRYIPAETAKFK